MIEFKANVISSRVCVWNRWGEERDAPEIISVHIFLPPYMCFISNKLDFIFDVSLSNTFAWRYEAKFTE